VYIIYNMIYNIYIDYVVIQHVWSLEVLDGDIYVVIQHVWSPKVSDGDIYVVIQHVWSPKVLDDDIVNIYIVYHIVYYIFIYHVQLLDHVIDSNCCASIYCDQR
jgi:hypothetical protein